MLWAHSGKGAGELRGGGPHRLDCGMGTHAGWAYISSNASDALWTQTKDSFVPCVCAPCMSHRQGGASGTHMGDTQHMAVRANVRAHTHSYVHT